MVCKAPSILATIVIEWENIQLAEADRCSTMLAELMRQIDAYPADTAGHPAHFEVLLVFDEQKMTEADVREFCRQCIPNAARQATLRYVPSPGLGYYEQKNLGAREAQGSIVVFLDSDVIPEAGWLSKLLSSFKDPAVNVVCGNCFLAAEDVVSKSLALAWFFPLRETSDSLMPRDSFFANNVAFRREVALAHPFVPLEGTSRGACRMLARRLTADRVGLFINTGARVSHPAPNGLRHLVARGATQGRDNLLFNRLLDRGSLGSSLARALRLQTRAWRRILLEHRKVGLGVLGIPAALAIASFYYVCYFAGDMLTRVAPAWAAQHVTLEG